MAIHLLGIRHHGPGSARNVKAFLEAQKPDIILVEGPPEAEDILQWTNHADVKLPVAILAYQTDHIQQSAFYPFAEFSPEWQAILFAKKNSIPLRFMDLPLAHSFALKNSKLKTEEEIATPIIPDEEKDIPTAVEDEIIVKEIFPLEQMAHIAGYDNNEDWWNSQFEERQNTEQIFEAVATVMTEARSAKVEEPTTEDILREAYMRKIIREAEREMFTNIVVICGAWHVPALSNMGKAKDDNELLKGLSKVKVNCTLIPWTNSRLSYFSGYGAGIKSPSWYEHIWKSPNHDGIQWLVKVAKLLRKKQMDTSVAHLIEAVKLAKTLTVLREKSTIGLDELNEATITVLCNGESTLMQLIQQELIVGYKMGKVPNSIPKPPLQVDIESLQKKLRLLVSDVLKEYVLDLRKDIDLERSIFLHRLQILDIKWGSKVHVNSKGTFKEQWNLKWDPEFSIEIIEKGNLGNTTETAATNYVLQNIKEATSLQVLCNLLELTIPAELADAIDGLIQQINNIAASTTDVVALMEVVPPLVNISRYGNVRKTDVELVQGIVESMVTRICISLTSACTGVAEDAAQELVEMIQKLNEAILILSHQELTKQWQDCLQKISSSQAAAPIIAGYTTRLLNEYKILIDDALIKAFYYAMSTATAPTIAAQWLEGFLKGSGTILLFDENLWQILNNWIAQLDDNTFIDTLPLLRRTFANYTPSEKNKLGLKAKNGTTNTNIISIKQQDFDSEKAQLGVPIVMQMLGYTNFTVSEEK
jgi:hypothetical protein